MTAERTLVASALLAWKQQLERAQKMFAPLDDEQLRKEIAPGKNRLIYLYGHLLAVLIARWCQLDPIEGRRFALATATVSLLGWHRQDRVIRTLNHRAGGILDPPFRT